MQCIYYKRHFTSNVLRSRTGFRHLVTAWLLSTQFWAKRMLLTKQINYFSTTLYANDKGRTCLNFVQIWSDIFSWEIMDFFLRAPGLLMGRALRNYFFLLIHKSTPGCDSVVFVVYRYNDRYTFVVVQCALYMMNTNNSPFSHHECKFVKRLRYDDEYIFSISCANE